MRIKANCWESVTSSPSYGLRHKPEISAMKNANEIAIVAIKRFRRSNRKRPMAASDRGFLYGATASSSIIQSGASDRCSPQQMERKHSSHRVTEVWQELLCVVVYKKVLEAGAWGNISRGDLALRKYPFQRWSCGKEQSNEENPSASRVRRHSGTVSSTDGRP